MHLQDKRTISQLSLTWWAVHLNSLASSAIEVWLAAAGLEAGMGMQRRHVRIVEIEELQVVLFQLAVVRFWEGEGTDQ